MTEAPNLPPAFSPDSGAPLARGGYSRTPALSRAREREWTGDEMDAVDGAPAVPAIRMSTIGWVRAALRAAVLRRPGTGAAAPAAWQLALLVLLVDAAYLALERTAIDGPAQFYPALWFAGWWPLLPVLWAVWWARTDRSADRAAQRGPLAAWLLLYLTAAAPVGLLLSALQVWQVRDPGAWPAGLLGDAQRFAGHAWWAASAWALAVQVVLTARFVGGAVRTGIVGAVIGATAWFAVAWYQPAWHAERTAGDAAAAAPAPLQLSQAVFETQRSLLPQQAAALVAQRPGVVDVYGLTFAPYAGENVFRRESAMVAGVLAERFDAQGRVLQLVNHAETADTLPWATPDNLQRAIAAIAARMDKDEDVLVVYLTSHGARNHALAAQHGPLSVADATPQLLRQALDDAGVRHRVVAVSACYSGGWVAPLASDHTLVMTAADATHTSYGCGSRSELTFFGRAVFDEGLRRTRSFESAFAAAVPVIAQREIDAGKADGFSNPQIAVGPQIAPVLQALAQRLDAAPATKP